MREIQNPYFSKVIDKGLRILSLFNPDCVSLSLKEISLKTGINSSSTFRFVDTLVQLGYLRKDSRTKEIKLGPKALTLAHNFIKSFDLLQILIPILDEAYDTYNVSIDSGLLEEDVLLSIYHRVVKDTLTFKLPMVVKEVHSTALGKAILAHLPEDEISAIIDRMDLVQRTKNTLSDKNDLMADLKKTKSRGYALSNEEFLPGFISIAAPFFNLYENRPIGAISFDFSTIQHSLKAIEKDYARIVLDLGKKISQVMPYE
jgi:IclR family pca regulon transcriptional regulator